jgi:predicted porin
MKKSLFALAAVTAFAGAAQAQSSVTVYGIMDVGYIGGNNRGFSSAGAPQKQTYNSFGSSAESTSRLGFRGTEDLGGGMRAFFNVEVALQPNSTTALSSNRVAFAGLSQKGIGQISFGTNYTPIHTAVGATSAGQQNNMVGDVIYPIAPGNNGNTVGDNAAISNASSSTGIANTAGNTAAYTVRTQNMMRVQSENVAGFVGTAFYTMANQDSTQTSATAGGTNDRNGWGLGVNYTWKKLLVTANYQSFLANQTTSTTLGLWTSQATASNVKDNQQYYAATYDFGILKAYAQYINRKATSELNASQYLQRSAQQIGVRGFVTKSIEAWASGGTGRFDSINAETVNFTGYQLGSNYWLSKRTNLYAIFGSTQQSSSSLAAQPSAGANNYALGVRHTF